MKAFERFNAVIGYIEDNLAGEIDYVQAAQIACCPRSQFHRFFSYIAEISLPEYIRRRRLTLCAFELQQNKTSVLDVAVKYGYDSHASFARAFREFHGMSPTGARSKGAVLHIHPRLILKIQDDRRIKGHKNMAVLGNIEFIELPAVRMIGIRTINGGGRNPVPELWAKCFRENAFAVLEQAAPVVDYFVGWMGEYNAETGQFTYIAGLFMPAGTAVPEGFDYRDLPPCLVGNGYINGDFAGGEVFRHSHGLTLDGMALHGYEPDYSFGWSAEAYARDLSFDAEEGTINYFCPCRKATTPPQAD